MFDQSNVPGTGYIAAGPAALAKNANVPITQLTENVPINDANSVALKEVDDAGPNGAVVLNFTPPEALVILQAAQKLGLENRVKAWACSTPCNTDFLAKSLGTEVGRQVLRERRARRPRRHHNTPTMNLYKAILKQYGTDVSGGIGSFSQIGFAMGEIAMHALESVKGPYTAQSVNKAFQSVKDYDTGLLCQLWTFGNYPAAHPQQPGLHGHAEQRQDGAQAGLHEHLLDRPADRPIPQGGRYGGGRTGTAGGVSETSTLSK